MPRRRTTVCGTYLLPATRIRCNRTTQTSRWLLPKHQGKLCSRALNFKWVYFLSIIVWNAIILCQGEEVIFETGYGQNEISTVDISCKAVECSPPPTFMWMIGRSLCWSWPALMIIFVRRGSRLLPQRHPGREPNCGGGREDVLHLHWNTHIPVSLQGKTPFHY